MEALNHYEQREVLGQGTYGVCHLAIDRRNGMQYAMKRITLRNEKDAQSAQKEADVRIVPYVMVVMYCAQPTFAWAAGILAVLIAAKRLVLGRPGSLRAKASERRWI